MDFNDEPVAIDLANQIRAACPGAIVTMPIGCQNVNTPDDLLRAQDLLALDHEE